MPKYLVHVTCSEAITFAVEATDEDDALVRYLRDGDEIASEPVGMEVDEVTLAENDD